MAFIYDAELHIHSVIDELDESGLAVGEPEISINTLPGFLKYDRESGNIFLSYAEYVEGERILTDIAVSATEVTLSRRGAIKSDIVFREGESTESLYTVPPYSFDMTVTSKKVRSTLTKDGGELMLIYEMVIGGATKAVRMKLRADLKKKSTRTVGV